MSCYKSIENVSTFSPMLKNNDNLTPLQLAREKGLEIIANLLEKKFNHPSITKPSTNNQPDSYHNIRVPMDFGGSKAPGGFIGYKCESDLALLFDLRLERANEDKELYKYNIRTNGLYIRGTEDIVGTITEKNNPRSPMALYTVQLKTSQANKIYYTKMISGSYHEQSSFDGAFNIQMQFIHFCNNNISIQNDYPQANVDIKHIVWTNTSLHDSSKFTKSDYFELTTDPTHYLATNVGNCLKLKDKAKELFVDKNGNEIMKNYAKKFIKDFTIMYGNNNDLYDDIKALIIQNSTGYTEKNIRNITNDLVLKGQKIWKNSDTMCYTENTKLIKSAVDDVIE